MKKVFEEIIASNDMQAIKNCVTIMADCCEVGMNDSVMLDMMKKVQSEIGDCHFDEEMADMHLCLIGQLHTKDVAKDYWHEVKNDNIITTILFGSKKSISFTKDDFEELKSLVTAE